MNEPVSTDRLGEMVMGSPSVDLFSLGRELAVIQLEAHRAVLDVQIKSIEQTLGALKGGR